ncbi:ABC-type Mn2+/Zn2+ transport system, permease component [Beggiatoa alba B18LD]|uniref:High-affinity zinc uptake system membrane protein ZnuB n=1 Tax=Beggiatoa alba B18LD TaxID=395493 RepID=I3CH69_9GAMM|nr:zinc ABC transporter permease subunit ZnuB [Beggiatoa alba]EIJ42962.1 ABC-type Mn2+/Zn2+ transport system, permease component [Beggiatoa alba B18LD]
MMIDDFIWRAVLGGIGVALIAGPLGCFVVWRRMAYFGDTLSHSALLGIALGILFKVNLNLGVMLICLLIALLLSLLQQQKRLTTDTLLGILSHSMLSLGLVVVAFMDGIRIDLYSYLFGDLLAVTQYDLYWIYGGGSLVLLGLVWLWQSLLSITIHEELAEVEGVPVVWVRLFLMLMIALVIAVAMKVVGILLITSLLIIPPATARWFARTPEQMAIIASILGCLAVLGGVFMSLHWDTPTGPSVVVTAAAMFMLTLVLPKGRVV